MKILLLGKNGQLGWELQRTLLPLGEIFSIDYPQIDLANKTQILELLHSKKPNLIINATAYTAVDKAESESELAFKINAVAPAILAEEAKKSGAGLIHYSTDYVFDGKAGRDYLEEDQANPLSVYGASKLAGEKEIQNSGCKYLILRTSWVYSLRKSSFVTKVLQWSRNQEMLKVVTDQIANPTWCRMLAEVSTQILVPGLNDLPSWVQQYKGLYHLAGSGSASRYQFAQKILEFDPQPEEQKVRYLAEGLTGDFPSPAQRPTHSALNCDKFHRTFTVNLPNWEDTLKIAMQNPE